MEQNQHEPASAACDVSLRTELANAHAALRRLAAYTHRLEHRLSETTRRRSQPDPLRERYSAWKRSNRLTARCVRSATLRTAPALSLRSASTPE